MPTSGKENRGPHDSDDSLEDVKEALRMAVDESDVPVVTLTSVVDHSEFSKPTVNKRLKALAEAGECSSGEHRNTTYYWIEEGDPLAGSGAGAAAPLWHRFKIWGTAKLVGENRNDIYAWHYLEGREQVMFVFFAWFIIYLVMLLNTNVLDATVSWVLLGIAYIIAGPLPKRLGWG